ncbi:MAG: TonB-dependent receptor, partial [Gemmatimonadaceae bacterium]
MISRPTPRIVLAGALCLLPLLALDARAQQRPEEQRRDSGGRTIAPVVVRGIRAPTVVGGAGAVVAVVDSLRLPAAPLLEEALRAMPFILVHRNSRGETELSVRGSDSRQTAILLDGVPLTLGWDNRSDVSLVPITGATRISLVRGLSSLLHGPNVLGGVVEVSLADGAGGEGAPSSLILASSVDQLGGHSLQAAGGGPLGGGVTARGGVGYRDRPGLARSGGLVEPGPDADLRTNSDARELDLFGALGWRGAS